ncbi:MAG: oligosaccharide flippase family protein [Bacteroidales bacterium]|jgi:O-antigen/teichoic acid export membrane protein
MGFKKTFLKNASAYGGYSYLSWFFDTLVSTIILSRFLGPSEYGFVALISVFSGFVLMFADTGLSFAVIRSDYGLKYHKIVFNLTIWVGVFLCLILCLLAYPITLIYEKPALFWPTIVISTQFLTNSINIVPLAILRKKLEFRFIGFLNFIAVVFTITLMIILAVLGFSYWSLILPLIVKPIFRHFFLERKLKFGVHFYGWKLTRLGIKKTRSLLESVSIFNVINYFARNADNFAIGKFYGEANLGLYDRAYKFLYMARRLINSTIGPVLFPSLVDIKSKGEEYRQHFLDILGMLNVFNIFIAVPLMLLAKPIALILWGQDWIGVAEYMPYIGAIIPLQTLLIAVMDLYVVENREKALLSLGIPMQLILVSGIVAGAFFSALHIVRGYAIAFIFVQTPVSLYFGHYRILKFRPKQIFRFWVPKVILTGGFIFSIWFGNKTITAILSALFILDTFISQGKDLLNLFIALKKRVITFKNRSKKRQ